MREPALGLKTSLLNGSSFLKRILENLLSVWTLPQAALPGATPPIHLLDEGAARTRSAAQLGSTLLHVAACAALIGLTLHPAGRNPAPANPPSFGRLEFSPPKWLQDADNASLGKHGSSGGDNPLPPTSGELAPASRSLVVPLHLTDSHPHQLNVPVAVHDADAPEFVKTVTEVGLPWMKNKNNSEGHGKHGIGVGDTHGIGDGPGDGVGVGEEAGPYANVASQVICRVCPEPLYSEEARKTKVQGSVTLAVLVGSDGRAKDVRVLQGIGMGLDESAAQTVRTWQFIPARDAAHRPVASWIKVETMFRLY